MYVAISIRPDIAFAVQQHFVSSCNALEETALRLWDHGGELKDICEALRVSERSCYCWRRIFEEFDTATKPPAPLTDRTRIITRALLTGVEDRLLKTLSSSWTKFVRSQSSTKSSSAPLVLQVESDDSEEEDVLSRNLKQAGVTRKTRFRT